MMNVRWLRTAAANFEREYQWLYEKNPVVAQNFANEVYALTSLLATQPAMGRAGRVMGTRELVLRNFSHLLPYCVKDNEVQILRVFHTYREPPKVR